MGVWGVGGGSVRVWGWGVREWGGGEKYEEEDSGIKYAMGKNQNVIVFSVIRS